MVEPTGWICARCGSSNAPICLTCPECQSPSAASRPPRGPRPPFSQGQAFAHGPRRSVVVEKVARRRPVDADES